MICFRTKLETKFIGLAVLLLVNLKLVLSANLFDTSGATSIFSTAAEFTNKNGKEVTLDSQLYIAGSKLIPSVFVSPYGGLGLFGDISANNLNDIKNSDQITENVILAGIIKPDPVTSTSSYSVTYKYWNSDSNDGQNVHRNLENSVIGIPSGTLYESHIFTFDHPEHKFQVIIAQSQDGSKVYYFVNINICDSCGGIVAESIFTGIYSYAKFSNPTTNAATFSECQRKLSSTSFEVQFMDISTSLRCDSDAVGKFSTFCDDSLKISGDGDLYQGFYSTAPSGNGDGLLSHGTFYLEHKCDIDNRYGESSSLSDGQEYVNCVYTADTYNFDWVADTTTCDIIFCAEPTSPSAAIIVSSPTYFSENSEIIYQCPAQYEFANGSTRNSNPVNVTVTCSSNNTGDLAFTTTNEVCQPLQCAVPAVPNGATVISSPESNTFGKMITYRCPNGQAFAPALEQSQLSTVCIENNGILEYQTLTTTGCQNTGQAVIPTKDLTSAIDASFIIDISCDPSQSSGLSALFSNAFAGLILNLQNDASSNFQDYNVDSVVCDEVTSQYLTTVKFNEVRDASVAVGYNEKSDLANTYLAKFTEYVSGNNFTDNLANSLGGQRANFEVVSVSITDSSDPDAPPLEISGAIIKAKSELQNAIKEAAPTIDPTTGETSSSFTDAISKTKDAIRQQISAISSGSLTGDAEASVLEKQAELDLANNMMETMSSVFGDWTSTTPELNATTAAMEQATQVADLIIGVVSKNTVSAAASLAAGGSADAALTIRPEVANSFLQSMNDMMSFMVQSADDLSGTFSPLGDSGNSDTLDIKINVIDSNNIASLSSAFGSANNNNRKKRTTTDQSDTAVAYDISLKVDVPDNAINAAKNNGKCGDEIFSSQRQTGTVEQTNYLNSRKRRDSVNTDGKAAHSRVTVQNLYTDQCYFTIPVDSQLALEGPCISTRLCGNRHLSKEDLDGHKISITIEGKYNNLRNLKEPELACVWWNPTNRTYESSGLTVVEQSYDSTTKDFKIVCQSEHLTTFTFLINDGYQQFLSPLWWIDFVTTIIVAASFVFLIGTYTGFWRQHSSTMPLYYKTSLLKYATIFSFLIIYLLGQFIGTRNYGPNQQIFEPASQISVVFFSNYFTLCIFTMFLVFFYAIYNKHVGQAIGNSNPNAAQSNNDNHERIGPILKVLLVAAFVIPLIIQVLNIGILAAINNRDYYGLLDNLRDLYSRLASYYGGSNDDPSVRIARFWPANSSFYYGVIAPIGVMLLLIILISFLVIIRLKKQPQILNKDPTYLREFCELLLHLVLYIATFSFGFASSEVGTYDQNLSTTFFWVFVGLKFGWMLAALYLGIVQRSDIRTYLAEKFCYEKNNKIGDLSTSNFGPDVSLEQEPPSRRGSSPPDHQSKFRDTRTPNQNLNQMNLGLPQ